MKPYYEHAGITIYHGDCRDVLPTIPSVDLVLTDPPYGIGKDGQTQTNGGHGGRKGYEFLGWDQQRPDRELITEVIQKGIRCVLWGGNYFSDVLPATSKWFVWDKGQRINQSDGELAWTSESGALRIYTANRVKLLLDGACHPTQKPVCLMTWCINQFPDTQTILDPFMGSGTTLLAAKNMNLRATGIDREESYCEIAAKRLSQEVFAFA